MGSVGEIEQQGLAARFGAGEMELARLHDRGAVTRRQDFAVDGNAATDDLNPGAATCGQMMAGSLVGTEESRVEVGVLMDRDGSLTSIPRPDQAQPTTLVLFRKRLLLVGRLQPVPLGNDQICRKWTGAFFEALYSLWRTPVPADMRWISPGRMTDPVPMLSLCSSAPSRT